MSPVTLSPPANLQTQWARLVIGSLCASGINDFIVSPGSRSTPLVSAIQACGQARLIPIIDERTAAFVALGQARKSGRPSALICTSGTAPAHYFPALIEASYSNVPIVVLTADRPPESQGNASPQTIDQQRLFGHHVRQFIDLGAADSSTTSLAGLTRKIAQGVAACRYPLPGPVHFNFPARKPLEHIAATTPQEVELEQRVDEHLRRGLCRFESAVLCPSAQVVESLAQRFSEAQRPILFLGPSTPTACIDGIVSFARRTHWPVFAEATHRLKFSCALTPQQLCHHFELALRAGVLPNVPDLVVCVGATATSRAWLDLLSREDGPDAYVIDPYRWTDASNRARAVVAAEPSALLQALTQNMRVADNTWLSECVRASEAAGRATAEFVSAPVTTEVEQPIAFTEAHVLHQLSARLAHDDTIVLGNSLSIRLAETFLQPKMPCHCVSQRGVNGIDGLIAGSVGTSLASRGHTWLILGDVSAVHDLGALRTVVDLQPELTICLLDNDGGRLFDELPIAQVAVDLSPWTTRHGTDFAALGEAFGLRTYQVTSHGEFQRALADCALESGPNLIVCKVAPHGARGVYTQLERLTVHNFTHASTAGS